MSGQWEVVAKKKERSAKIIAGQPSKKASKDGKKMINTLSVNIEDVLAKSQMKSLYNNTMKQQQDTKNKKIVNSNNNINNSNKVTTTTKKPQEVVAKAKPHPKSIESALNTIDANEFAAIFERTKLHFPDAPIVWLKELAQHLNQKLITVDHHDPTSFSTNKPTGYPLSAMPIALKTVISNAIDAAGPPNAQLFFDIALTSMVTDMAKNLPALGHKLFLQYVALTQPDRVLAGLSKHKLLVSSYQNRASIGLSIFWAIGQVGQRDQQAGLKVFKELMQPLSELKNYSRFVIKYLLDLVNRFDDNNLSAISQNDYLMILDTLYLSNNKSSSLNEYKQETTKANIKLKKMLFNNNMNNNKQYVDTFIKQLSATTNINNNKTIISCYQDLICDAIIECFAKDSGSIDVWIEMYRKNLVGSVVLLNYISNNWSTITSKNLFNSNVLVQFTNVNRELLAQKKQQQQRKDDGLVEAQAAIKKLLNKMANRPTQSRNYNPYSRRFCFMTFLIIAMIFYYDVKAYRTTLDAKTREDLSRAGITGAMTLCSNRIGQYWSWFSANVEEQFPTFYKTVYDYSAPYKQLFRDVAVIIYNLFGNVKELVLEKYPIVTQTIEFYAPGLLEFIQKCWIDVRSKTIYYFTNSADYLKKEVFVGQLSPENMQRVVGEAFNTTQQKATEYYYWLYEKFHTTLVK